MNLSPYLAVFGNRRIAAVLGLGFASGLPLALSGSSLQAWLTVEGMDIKTIAWFTLIGQPYTLKFLWSPLMDRFEPPQLGHRRGWIWLTQIALALLILGMASINPLTSLAPLAATGLALAFMSASQDIAFDAYRTELLKEEERGAGAAVMTLGYRLGMLSSGALALIIADQWLSWPDTFRLLAAIMAATSLITLLSPRLGKFEVSLSNARAELRGFAAMVAAAIAGYALAAMGMGLLGVPFTDYNWLGLPQASGAWGLLYLVGEVTLAGVLALWAARRASFPAFIEPLDEFIARPAAWAILALIILYKLGDAFAVSLSTTFLMRGLGFSQTVVGEVNKVFGLIATLLGALLGGLWMTKLGLWRSLLWFGVLQAVSNLMYWWLALAGKDYVLMVVAVGIENLCGGLGSTAFVALLMSLCNQRYTATQFALLSALAAFGRVYVGPAAGVMVDSLGWPTFFLCTVFTALPGLILLMVLKPHIEALHRQP